MSAESCRPQLASTVLCLENPRGAQRSRLNLNDWTCVNAQSLPRYLARHLYKGDLVKLDIPRKEFEVTLTAQRPGPNLRLRSHRRALRQASPCSPPIIEQDCGAG